MQRGAATLVPWTGLEFGRFFDCKTANPLSDWGLFRASLKSSQPRADTYFATMLNLLLPTFRPRDTTMRTLQVAAIESLSSITVANHPGRQPRCHEQNGEVISDSTIPMS
jgi:hypothetical protein